MTDDIVLELNNFLENNGYKDMKSTSLIEMIYKPILRYLSLSVFIPKYMQPIGNSFPGEAINYFIVQKSQNYISRFVTKQSIQ